MNSRDGKRWLPGRAAMSVMAAIALIAACVFPWGDFQGHTHWAKVGWVPFVSRPLRVSDVILNVMLFLPLGVSVAIWSRSRSSVRSAVAVAFVVSFLGEWSQLYSHTRFPSATDLVCNVAGAALGAAVVRRLTYPGR